MYRRYAFAKPRKRRTSRTEAGSGQERTAETRAGSMDRPVVETMCPRKSIESTEN